MKAPVARTVLIAATAVAGAARAGHEFPIYPSYYPHEIRIDVVAPGRAPDLLLASKIHAYIGPEPRFRKPLPDSIRAIESLGSFVRVRVNPQSASARDNAAACAVARAVVADIARRPGPLVFHPYPVTSLHGDFLYHADQADAARTRLAAPPAEGASKAPRRLKVRAIGELARSLVREDWYSQRADWDAVVEEVNASSLIASQATNGWTGPPWARAGWFHAARLLADAADDAPARDRIQDGIRRLEHGGFRDAVERINVERDLLSALTASCHAMVAGYTVKREYVSTEYSAGIENIGFDALAGLNSPLFIRTVKLKDFPWNGWLALGIDASPASAWNPIAGFTDQFGQLLWAALGDPAQIPSPGDAGWMFNRVSDVRADAP